MKLDGSQQGIINTLQTEQESVSIFKEKYGFLLQGNEPPKNTRTLQHNLIKGLSDLTVVSSSLGKRPPKLVDNKMHDKPTNYFHEKKVIWFNQFFKL